MKLKFNLISWSAGLFGLLFLIFAPSPTFAGCAPATNQASVQSCPSDASYSECVGKEIGGAKICKWEGPAPVEGPESVCSCKITITGQDCSVNALAAFSFKETISPYSLFEQASWTQCPFKTLLDDAFKNTPSTVLTADNCSAVSLNGTQSGLTYQVSCQVGINKSTPADGITSEYLKGRYSVPEGYKGPIPECAFSGTCRSTSDLVILLINIAKFLFSLIGVVAFAAFIYGGFMMIFSFGNSEKVGQGKDAMVAAVVGLVIAFGAYLIINFILNALGVVPEFKGIIN